MGGKCIRDRLNRFHLRASVLSGILVFAVVMGIGTVTRAVSVKHKDQVPSGKTCFLNPFKCKTIYVAKLSGKDSKAISKENWTTVKCLPQCPPVVAPHKPTCRTPYQPPWWWDCHRHPYYRGGKIWGRSSSPGCRW
jgi:hypothetical protein